ncbi:MAG: iron ABC transporter permease [Actinobacteria bacterium]|nr:iron ABC transporter permease [Actinomycetota bacterium]
MTTRTAEQSQAATTGAAERDRPLGLAIAVALLLLLGSVVLSLTVNGTQIYSPLTVWRALLGHGNILVEAAVKDIWLPRTIVSLMIGAGLAVAGALIQAITRNPIVEPSIIGINSGAALAVATVTFFGETALQIGSVTLMPFIAFVGALAAAGLVYAMVSGIDVTPGRIALAGVTVALLANALVSAIILFRVSAVYLLLHYLVGGVGGTTWTSVQTLLPYEVIGLTAALLVARPVTVLQLGDDVARGLGQSVARVRITAIGVVVVLAGAAVAVAGPVAMVGLLVPHVARWLVGTDYRRVLPVCMMLGAVLLVAADVASRMVAPPTETPVGVLTALLGTPYFIYLARRGRGAV